MKLICSMKFTINAPFVINIGKRACKSKAEG